MKESEELPQTEFFYDEEESTEEPMEEELAPAQEDTQED